MGQTQARIIHDEDNIIRVKHDLIPMRFPGGMGTVFFNKMREHKENVAQIDGPTGKTQTYADLLQKSIRTALEMRSRGIRPKDIVTICSHNHLDTVVPLYVTLFLGAIPASLDPSLSLSDTAILISQVQPRMFFVFEESVKLIADALKKIGHEAEVVVFGASGRYTKFSVFLEEKEGEGDFVPVKEVDDEDTAIIFFSSGTTALPKGLCLTHYALLNHAEYYAFAVNHHVYLSYASLHWVSSINWLAVATMAGDARVVAREYQAGTTWNYIEKYRVSYAFLPTSISRDLCRFGRPSGINTTSLKIVLTGAERTSVSLIKELNHLFPGTFVTQAYGLTEVCGLLTSFCSGDAHLNWSKPASCGRPVVTIDEYKIVDPETGVALGPNTPGELRVKGRLLMKGYYNLDSSVAFDEDGYLKTGDVVYYDEDFCFFIVDRTKEMIWYRNWQIAPVMLEEVLLTHPAVDAAVVFGIPDENDSDHPMACVILKKGVSGVKGDEIRRYVDERVEDRKKLRGGVVIVNSFPTTATGKVSRRLLRDLMFKKSD